MVRPAPSEGYLFHARHWAKPPEKLWVWDPSATPLTSKLSMSISPRKNIVTSEYVIS